MLLNNYLLILPKNDARGKTILWQTINSNVGFKEGGTLIISDASPKGKNFYEEATKEIVQKVAEGKAEKEFKDLAKNSGSRVFRNIGKVGSKILSPAAGVGIDILKSQETGRTNTKIQERVNMIWNQYLKSLTGDSNGDNTKSKGNNQVGNGVVRSKEDEKLNKETGN